MTSDIIFPLPTRGVPREKKRKENVRRNAFIMLFFMLASVVLGLQEYLRIFRSVNCEEEVWKIHLCYACD